MLNVFRSGRGQWVNQERVCVRVRTQCVTTISCSQMTSHSSFELDRYHSASFSTLEPRQSLILPVFLKMQGNTTMNGGPLFITLRCVDRKSTSKMFKTFKVLSRDMGCCIINPFKL